MLCLAISQDYKRGSVSISYESHFSFFPDTGAGKTKLQLKETGKQSSTKAVQHMQKRSLKSLCSVNFKCGNSDSIKQGLTPLVTLYSHLQIEPTVRACRLQLPVLPFEPSSGTHGRASQPQRPSQMILHILYMQQIHTGELSSH